MNTFQKIAIIASGFLFMLQIQVAKAQAASISDENVSLKVFPNPSKANEATYFSLDGIETNSMLVVVYDMLGREIYSKVELVENKGYLYTLSSDGSKLPSGVYLITASAEDKVFHQKIIVKS